MPRLKSKNLATWEYLGITDKEVKQKNLSEKQLKFAYNYVTNGFNASKAYIGAGYKTENPNVLACNLLSKPYIRELVRKVIDRELDQYKDTIQYEIIEKSIAIITADISDFVTEKGERKFDKWEEVESKAVESVKKDYNARGDEKWSIKLHDPMPYIELLNRYLELAEPEKKELNITVKFE